MQLSILSFTTAVQNAAAKAQSACTTALDFTVGSVLRAALEANAAVALWLQWLILQVQSMTRLSTCTGADVDTWVGDWGLARQGAAAATGMVTFSRNTAAGAAILQPGTTVRTLDATQTFTVMADPTNAAWSPQQSAYVAQPGVLSVSAPVQAITLGSSGNVGPGAIGLISSAASGFTSVTNPLAFTNGADSQSDASLKAAFPSYLASLSRATPKAILFAVSQVQNGLDVALAEDTDGSLDEFGNPVYRPGWFVVAVDDGSGNPTQALLQSVAAAVEAYRGVGTTGVVMPPAVQQVGINVVFSVRTGVNKTSLIGVVASAITDYVDSLNIGQMLSYTKLAQVIIDAAPAIVDVPTLALNGAAQSVTPPLFGVVRPGTVTVA